MKKMVYYFKKKFGQNFGKGEQTQPHLLTLKGKNIAYYNKSKRGLGYVSNPATSESNSDESVYHDHSSCMSLWSSYASVDMVFKALFVNMVTMIHPKEVEDDGLLQSEEDYG